jgi:hypothetical protein
MNAATARQASESGSFATLVAKAGGRHPIEVFEALADRPRTDDEQRAYAEAAAPSPPGCVLSQGSGLPLPHPLDSEWRFEDATADALLAEAVARTRAGDSILLLGVPTVVMRALRSAADRRFVVRSEANVIGTALERATAADSRFVTEHIDPCAAAITDPPWYPELYDALLAEAAAACCDDGLVFSSAPPEGVRPAAADEWRAALASAERRGLELVEIRDQALAYRTPAFEVAAMRAAGLGVWLPHWRRGNQVIFRKSRQIRTPLPVTSPPAFELTLSGVRMRLLANPAAATRPLSALVCHEVFPSVSARAVGRARANLWTSSNRAFVCDPLVALAAMQRIATARNLWPKRLDPPLIASANSQSIDVIRLAEELSRIAARDLAHTAALVGESSWDRSVNDARFLNGSSNGFLRSLRGTID